MKKHVQKFIPSFLEVIDQKSLLKHRLLWLTKLHYIIFYMSIAIALGVAVISMITPYVLLESSKITIMGYIALAIPFMFWIYKQVTFSIERNYGRRNRFTDQIRFGFYLICTMIFISAPEFLGLMTDYAKNQFVKDDLFEKEQSILDLCNSFFLTTDEISFVTRNISDDIKASYLHEKGISADYKTLKEYQYPQSVRTEIIEKCNDISNFQDIDLYSNHMYPKVGHSWTRKQTDSANDKTQVHQDISEYIKVFNKYGGNIQLSGDDIIKIRTNEHKSVIDMTRYINHLSIKKQQVRNHISNIRQGKSSWKRVQKEFYAKFSMLFFISFFISTLLTLHNIIGFRNLAISAVGFIALAIISSLTFGLAGELMTYTDQSMLRFMPYLIILGAYAFIFAKTLSIYKSTHFSQFQTACLVILIFSTPFAIWWINISADTYGGQYLYRNDEFYINRVWLGVALLFILNKLFLNHLLIKVSSLPR